MPLYTPHRWGATAIADYSDFVGRKEQLVRCWTFDPLIARIIQRVGQRSLEGPVTLFRQRAMKELKRG
jgi:hypothetical protein